jgi:SPP1 gp7 family putative phage head morphogenesis protein
VRTQKEIRKLSNHPTSVNDIFDEDAEAEIWAVFYDPFFTQGFVKGIDMTAVTVAVEDVFSKVIRDALKRKTFEHAALAINTTKDMLQAALTESLKKGESIAELGRRINDLYGESMGYRSRRIARTEMTDVINDGASLTLERENFAKKEWSTVIDGRERPSHAAADGQVVGIHESFTLGFERAQYPGDENLSPGERVNCRCVVVGAGIPEDRKIATGKLFLRSHSALERRFVLQLLRAFREQRDRILSQFPKD